MDVKTHPGLKYFCAWALSLQSLPLPSKTNNKAELYFCCVHLSCSWLVSLAKFPAGFCNFSFSCFSLSLGLESWLGLRKPEQVPGGLIWMKKLT